MHPGGPAPFSVLADDALALIEALGLERPLVAGFGEGAATVTIVALRRPEAVRAIVNHAGFDIFDPHATAHQTVRPIFGGHPDATTADPDAAERAFQSLPPMAAVFATQDPDPAGRLPPLEQETGRGEPPVLEPLLDQLRPGDIRLHLLAGYPLGANEVPTAELGPDLLLSHF